MHYQAPDKNEYQAESEHSSGLHRGEQNKVDSESQAGEMESAISDSMRAAV